MSISDAPRPGLLIDLDCGYLGLSRQPRCDYLFGAEEDGVAPWVVPLELKTGRCSVNHVTEQLQAGADLADRWLSDDTSFRFVPVLAHGKKSIAKAGRIFAGERSACVEGSAESSLSLAAHPSEMR